MGLAQLELETARDKVEVAIDRLKEYGSDDKCWLAFGGGKDSVVIYDLALRAGIDFEAHYAQTGIDPPELVRFIRDCYPEVVFEKPLMTMWQGIELKGLPHRHKRWCCEKLKHHCGKDWVRITGIRWAESPMRRRYRIYNQMKRGSEICPIIDWSTNEVWEYIQLRQLPYCSLYNEGFSRLGCMICPLANTPNRQREAQRYPKVLEAYKRANRRHFIRKQLGSEEEADEYFIQWLGFEVEQENVDSNLVLERRIEINALKCDRCGEYFDNDPNIPRNFWREKVNGFTVGLVISQKGNPSDLCPSCIEVLTQEAIKQREKVRSLLG